jgi:Lrp/AsnC family transcriptional regulator, leucine-responsive regulatory protein
MVSTWVSLEINSGILAALLSQLAAKSHRFSRFNRNAHQVSTALDAIDRKILSLYQHDTRCIAASIGAKVGLSAAAVQRRLKQLRSTGVITAEIAVLDNVALGRPITCLVRIELASSAAQIDKFTHQMRDLAEVQQCYHVTGSSDIFLVVTAETMEGYRAFVRSWLEIPQVARYETHVVLDRVKVGLSLPTGKDRNY